MLQSILPFNPDLPFIKANWQGNPLDKNGRFVNLEHPFTTTFKDVWKWQRGPKPHIIEKKGDNWRPDFAPDASFLDNDEDCFVWLPHAWFFIRLGGVSMLVDPVLYKIPLVKQLILPPFSPQVFRKVDLVLLSHNHRDHMDKKSIQALANSNPRSKFITGLQNGNILKHWAPNDILEMGWYQQWEWPERNIKISYLPTRHWSRRYLSDTNKRLWGAFVIQANNKTIYFGSDSGFGSHFTETAELFPQIDLAMLGVGAYMPEWFMHQAHMSPKDGVQAFINLQAKHLFPMHYGALDLSDEPPSWPIKLTKEELTARNLREKLLESAIGTAVYI